MRDFISLLENHRLTLYCLAPERSAECQVLIALVGGRLLSGARGTISMSLISTQPPGIRCLFELSQHTGLRKNGIYGLLVTLLQKSLPVCPREGIAKTAMNDVELRGPSNPSFREVIDFELFALSITQRLCYQQYLFLRCNLGGHFLSSAAPAAIKKSSRQRILHLQGRLYWTQVCTYDFELFSTSTRCWYSDALTMCFWIFVR